MDPAETKRDALREGLRKWGSAQRSQDEHRDPLVLAALAAGITVEEVHQVTGLGRSTIERIVKKAREKLERDGVERP
jgi:transposase